MVAANKINKIRDYIKLDRICNRPWKRHLISKRYSPKYKNINKTLLDNILLNRIKYTGIIRLGYEWARMFIIDWEKDEINHRQFKSW